MKLLKQQNENFKRDNDNTTTNELQFFFLCRNGCVYEVIKSWKGKMKKKLYRNKERIVFQNDTYKAYTDIAHNLLSAVAAAVVVEWGEKATAIAE